MAQIKQFDYSKLPKYKVELHVHLDGAVRVTTLWELAQKNGIKLEAETLDDLYERCQIKCPGTLEDYLKPFSTCIIPVLAGDPEALERIAFEFCEDAARQKVLYCEARYYPHLYTNGYGYVSKPELKPLKARDVVTCVNKGLSRGSVAFDIKVRSILCCLRTHPEWSDEVLELCDEFKQQGVVGIDIAGVETKRFASENDIAVFKRAAELGIHRTAHTAEAGPAINVKVAIDEMLVERIGHGYHVVDDEDIYQYAKSKDVHFEVCPYSSYLTGSVSLESYPKHPIVRFAEDNVSFSISRDDPVIIQKTLEENYENLRGFGLHDIHFARANFNAALRSFLPDDEKDILLQQLREIWGIPTCAMDHTNVS